MLGIDRQHEKWRAAESEQIGSFGAASEEFRFDLGPRSGNDADG